jgi:uncharacterized repeat protein (TIGR01451 family)
MKKTKLTVLIFITILILSIGSTAAAMDQARSTISSGLDLVGSYDFYSFTDVFTPISGGTAHCSGALCDDDSFNAINIGFTFNYNGIDYTQVSINNNGFIAMGASVVNSYNPLSSGTSNNVISALGGDLQGNAGGVLRSELIGSSPNQVFIIQWTDYRAYAATGDSYSFQIQLHETTNQMIIAYGAFTKNATSRSYQVGLRGASNADFNNRTSTSSWTASTAGAVNSATMTLSQSVLPPSGLLYTWSVHVPKPDLSDSTKTALTLLESGLPLDYTVQILNSGDLPAGDATLVDPIPTGTTYVPGSVSCDAGNCYYDVGTNTVYWDGIIPTSPTAVLPSLIPAPTTAVISANQSDNLVPFEGTLEALASGQPATSLGSSGFGTPEAILWDNGPLITHPLGCTPTDASRLQTTLSMNTLGFGHQFSTGFRMADDFTVTGDGWQVDQITFFAYQSSAPQAPSPITGVYYQIWNGPPNDPGSSVVFGDLTTNRLLSSTFSAIQRDTETSSCANNRYIFTDVASAGVLLPAGTYWIDWMTDGSASYSGPWAPPVTILGQTTTGNAMQWTTAWAPALDTGTATQQDLPFVVEGTAVQEPLNPTTVSFSVMPEAACGTTYFNEATIDDPQILDPVLVSASTAVWDYLGMTESFDGETFPPAGWTEAIVYDPGTDPDWSRVTAGNYPTIAPHSGAAMAKFNSFSTQALGSARLATPLLDLSADNIFQVSFWMSHDTGYSTSADRIQVQVSTDGGTTWVDVGAPINRYDAAYGTPGWGSHSVSLAGYNQADVMIGFLGISAYGNNFYLDDIQIVGCANLAPNIVVTAPPLNAILPVDETTTLTFTIGNTGLSPLDWSISEVPGVMDISVGGASETTPQASRPVNLGFDASNGASSPTTNWNPDGPVNLVIDDGSRDNDIGIGGAWEFIWLNRFTPTPTDFPFYLDEVAVYFSTVGMVNVGDDMILVLYENTSGNADPAVGSNFLASFPVTVQALDTWNVYTLPTPVTFNGPGDVLVGVIGLELPGSSYWPASMDQTTTQSRSWAGWWLSSPPPATPTLPPDDTWILIDAYFPGNWMVRANGETITTDVPWLSESPITGTVGIGESVEVFVTFDSTGLSVGTYNAYLDIASNDPDEPLISLPAQLDVIAEPDIVVNAPPMDSVQLPDTQNMIPFEICNVGDANLDGASAKSLASLM